MCELNIRRSNCQRLYSKLKLEINYNTVETRNLEVRGTCKHNSKHPEIDSSESGFVHVIETRYMYAVTLHHTKLRLYLTAVMLILD